MVLVAEGAATLEVACCCAEGGLEEAELPGLLECRLPALLQASWFVR